MGELVLGYMVFGHGFQFRKFSGHGFLAMEGVLVIGGLSNGWFSMEAQSGNGVSVEVS